MRILLSTTIGHNPGDEIIAMGVMNLLRYGLKIQDLEVVVYNRNPDLQTPIHRFPLKTVGNYQTDPVDLSYIDAVVLAGSPEFFGGPMVPLYAAIRDNPTIPVYMMGVGLGSPGLELSALDQHVMKRKKTKIVTRSSETTTWLAKKEVDSVTRVCPALFCSMTKFETGSLVPLQVAQKPGTLWHEVDLRDTDGLDKSIPVLCLHVKELKHYHDLGFKVRYAGSGAAMVQQLAKAYEVQSTRLHAAIAALSLGIPATVVTNYDFRIKSAAAMFGELLPIKKVFNDKTHKLRSSDSIVDFKWEKWNDYLKLLTQMFGEI